MKILKALTLLLICTNILYAQKSKKLTLSAVSDFPISKKFYYNYGLGVEASYIINTPTAKNYIFTFSALQYQSYYYSFPSTSPVEMKNNVKESFLRTTVGKLIQVNDKLFINVQGGLGIGYAAVQQKSKTQLTFLAGPTIILPIKEKYCIKLNASFGYFAGGGFVNVGAAFGFKSH
jgi:hypothetical protein